MKFPEFRVLILFLAKGVLLACTAYADEINPTITHVFLKRRSVEPHPLLYGGPVLECPPRPASSLRS